MNWEKLCPYHWLKMKQLSVHFLFCCIAVLRSINCLEKHLRKKFQAVRLSEFLQSYCSLFISQLSCVLNCFFTLFALYVVVYNICVLLFHIALCICPRHLMLCLLSPVHATAKCSTLGFSVLSCWDLELTEVVS